MQNPYWGRRGQIDSGFECFVGEDFAMQYDFVDAALKAVSGRTVSGGANPHIGVVDDWCAGGCAANIPLAAGFLAIDEGLNALRVAKAIAHR